MKTRTIIAGQRLTVGLAAKALLASLLSIGLLVASATTANAAPAPDLTPFWVKTPSRVVAGQQVYFDSGIRNWGDKGTGVFNIKWLVDGKEVGAYGSHEGIPGHSSKLNVITHFSWTFTDP